MIYNILILKALYNYLVDINIDVSKDCSKFLLYLLLCFDIK